MKEGNNNRTNRDFGRDPNDKRISNIFRKTYDYLSRKSKAWKGAMMAFIVLIVFITTYGLILPAITIEKDIAQEMPGMDLASDSSHDEEYRTSGDPAESNTAGQEVNESSGAKIEGDSSTEDKDSHENSSTSLQLAQSPLKYNSGSYEYELIFDKTARIPEGTIFTVEEVRKNSIEYTSYKKALEKSQAVADLDSDGNDSSDGKDKSPSSSGTIVPKSFLRLKLYKDGEEIRPDQPVKLVINDKRIETGKSDAKTSHPEYGVIFRTKASDKELTASLIKLKYDNDSSPITISRFPYNKKKTQPVIGLAYKKKDSQGQAEDQSGNSEDGEKEAAEEGSTVDADGAEKDQTAESGESITFPESDFQAQTDHLDITVHAPEGALPEGTIMRVREIKDKEALKAITETVENSESDESSDKKEIKDKSNKDHGEASKKEVQKIQAVDITFTDKEGHEIEPLKDVQVTISSKMVSDVAKDDDLEITAVHLDDQGTGSVIEIESKKDKVSFESDSFSVYALVSYTVDFHYEVNGKVYEFSIPGGGFVSLEHLVELLGVNKSTTYCENGSESAGKGTENASNNEGEESDFNSGASYTAVDLNALEISEETRKFIADVESVEFSSPELVWVGKVESDSTVGGLKIANNLGCEYSAYLTEEQINEINAQKVEAGDWALISMKPFTSEESLTVTMKNGEQFVVRVTDAQDPSVYIGKEVIIYDNDEQRAMTSNGAGWDGHRNRLQSITVSEAEGSSAAHWRIEAANGGGYYLRSNDGQYLQINGTGGTDLNLVNNVNDATVLNIQAGSNPDYRISAANNNDAVLTYEPNGNYDGFFSMPSGTYSGTDNTNRWLYIREVEAAHEPAGDWLLYFDDDFSEITIHVGETITLRPYNKWEWKEGGVDVQTAHWNVGGNAWSDWSISSSDNNGSKLSTVTDGPFKFTRYVKEDNQLTTHYWSVQGLATQTGDYTLTNTKNGKTITVHVVDGDPVNKPNTINKIANIKVNLFDYDMYYLLDPSDNSNLANNSNNKSDSVNQMGGSNHFYFLSSGSGNNNNESWNSYTKDAANPNIVKSTLGSDGYPELNHGYSNTSLKYLFDTSQTAWHGGNNNDGMIAYPDVVGMFQKDSAGYYYFNSNTNYYYYDTATGTSKLYEHTYTQTSSADKNSLVNDKPIGFFPFHEYDATDNLYVNQNSNLNHHIGMSTELEFMLPKDRLDDNGDPIIFDFSGDDDLWVFVEWEEDNGVKQSQLLLDLGGVHQPIHGTIDFTNGSNTSFILPDRPYTLKMFYLERGGCDSNCSIRFNLPIVQHLTVAKKLTGLTEEEKIKYKDEKFTYEIVVNGQPYNYPNPANKYEKAVLRNAAGEDITPDPFTIVDGRVQIKDGETLTITYLDRSDEFSVSELKTSNMENFETPNAERYYHQEHDASLYEEEINLTASKTLSSPETDCWTTPTEAPNGPYELEDTEKVTFTNTLKEKNLEVEKKWVGDEQHPDSITFTVSATVDDGTGGRTAYAVNELTNSDGTDKVFTLSDANSWRHEIEHLPVYTPDGKFIFYDINEGQVDGYVLTGSTDITADKYHYCNVDVVKLWPDSNGEHTEILRVVLKNSQEQYYAGVNDAGEAVFSDDPELASVYELKPENNYTHRFARVPALPDGQTYSAVQLDDDIYTEGLALYVRNIIQYELENTPLENQIDPAEEPNEPVIHKRIDALRDGVANPDSAHADEDLTDLYRLYLDYKISSKQDTNGIDLLFVIDHSGSMNSSKWPGNQYRAQAVTAALNGNDGLISKFLTINNKNRWAAVGFKGPDGSRDYTWSLSNPWQPSTAAATDNAGQNGSEVLSSGSTFTRNAANIALPDEGASILSNYTAGFWRAEQFLLDQSVQEDGRKKVIVFISDGVPTLHIDDLNGSLQNAGTAGGSPYYHEENGGCPNKAITEFGYFVSDMTNAGYTFGEDMEFYTIGLGASMQTEGGANLLNGLLDKAYGEGRHEGHHMTISDAANSDYSAATNSLNRDLSIILGMNDTFSNLVIQDNLSKYVDLYGLSEEGSEVVNIMIAAKAKVTMTVPDQDAPSGSRTVTLYENGAPTTGDDAKFTKTDGTEATIIQELTYDAGSKTVQAVFDPEYHPAVGVTFTLSFDVKTTDTAYTTYAENGYDKYTSGEKVGQIITGDPDTDFLGTDPANATSVDKPGFRSNDTAKATYTHNNDEEEMEYPHPVIQVAAKADIVKIDQTGAALEGAKFNLYDNNYDPSKTIKENADHLIEADLQSKKPTDPAGNEAVIRDGKLIAGTYYLVETHAPDGFNSLPGPVKITVTETNGVLNMTAEIAGAPIVGNMLRKISKGVWKLQVQNIAGYELPSTGGPGTRLFTILGSILILGAGVLLWRRRKLI